MKSSYHIFIFLGSLLMLSQPLSLSAQDMQAVRQHIDTLCAPGMHGRGYVAGGDKIAANYIKTFYEQLGLKPFHNSYFQDFSLSVNTFPRRLSLKIDRTTLIPGKDYLISSISNSGKGRGRLLFLDSTFFHDSKYRQEFLRQNLKKRVLAYDEKYSSSMLELPIQAIDKLYETKAVIQLKRNKLIQGISQQQHHDILFQVPIDTLYAVLDTANKKPPKIKFRVDAKFFPNYTSQNVIGYIEGSTQPDSFVVFSAHYDHLGRMGKDTYFPGANDNASGVSMLLELAHYYSQPENKPTHSMAFMAFGAEEAGLVGSRHYVLNPLFPLQQINFLMNLDLVGTGDDGGTVVNGSVFKKEFEYLVKINEEKKYLPQIKARGHASNSDHYFFTERGVRSFFLYTLGGIQAYHDIYDRAETLPLTRYKGVFNLLIDFMNRVMNQEVE